MSTFNIYLLFFNVDISYFILKEKSLQMSTLLLYFFNYKYRHPNN